MHRLRMATDKDANPPGEVELLCDSLMNNGVLRGNHVIRWVPADAVLQLEIGDSIAIDEAAFERLSDAFFEELQRRLL